jgi:proteasome lid subunit RPN8/RPN11
LSERLFLYPRDARRIRELALAAWPVEACGLLEGAANAVHRVHRLENVAADPRTHFTIDPEAFLRVEHAARACGRTIIGVWHSHPHGSAVPSPIDRASAWPGWSYLIAGVTNAEPAALRSWQLCAGGFVPQSLVLRGYRP